MNATVRARGFAALVAGAVVVAGTVLAPTAASAAEKVVLSKGHTDAVDVHYSDGELSLKVHDDTVSPSVTRDPVDVTFQVLPEAAMAVPDDSRFAFLGPAGSQIWLLPMTQDPDLLWPGWNTTTLKSGVFDGNKVRLSLVDVEGPGNVTLFTQDSFGGPIIKFRSDDGLPDAIDVPVHTHAHSNWAFSALGNYTLKFQADATLVDGTTLSTGPVDYSFVVGELSGGGPEVSLAVSGMAAEYQPNDTVTLNAVQTPQTELDHYHWFSRCPGAADWNIISGEGGASYSFTATRELNACEYVAKLYDDDHAVVATSEPVTLWVAFPPQDPGTSQTITASIDETQGSLVISVNPDDRAVVLPPAQLNSAGDRWESIGELRPVTVTDTRAGQPGWSASGQIPADFVGPDGATFSAGYLGWTPRVLAQADGQGVVPGPEVSPYVVGVGGGLGNSAVLGSAPDGTGRGSAQLGAGLRLSLPTETAAGTYTATLTLTAI
ncbi:MULTISPECIES: choice-of-anchor M domain-containing protein [unclassified Micromonospora]|uniref:choice-of-anchor M domain-containing protein n=1 Tax=unclassified Micromonospora TaxID=2617518 RepID=UPI0022B5E938|nr:MULTISPECIES: choice-of-anchor M domain-containing protein [unclassified Micromonospora]MCZ7418675.1 choice-of-anchor M domain-containing protein [Verrucosispora sp. WMMA2121]WBB92377.1 choice-of-anchor M domain-containing protein [Verrucosispora sp. WMMC514]